LSFLKIITQLFKDYLPALQYNDAMELSIYHFLIVCPLVFLAGFVDAIAGGGGLISLPAYMISGLPVHTAIGTNKLSSAMGTTVATAKYAINGFINWKLAPFCAVFALCGSFFGAQISLLISDRSFKILMLFILPFVAFYVIKGKNLVAEKESFEYKKTMVISVFIAFAVGLYDGFYGPGTGTFLLLLLTALAHMSLTDANGTTKVINLTTNLTSLAVFLTHGTVILVLGLTAGLFNMLGNYLGAKFFSKDGARITRPVMLLVIALFMIKIIVELVQH